MADITVKGFVNKPEVKTTAGGKSMVKFSLSESYFDKKTKTRTYGFYNCTHWEQTSAPEDGSYVTVTGFLKQRQYESSGQKRTSMDINVQSVTVEPKKAPVAATADTDEFDL